LNKLVPLLLILSGPLSLAAQPTSFPLPPNYQTVVTTDTFKVIRVHYGPHEKVPVHDHPATPTVYVYLNNSGPVKIIHDETPPFTITRPPTHLGAFRVSPGRIERHSIENLSDLPSDFLRVELPHLRLGNKTLEFRGPAPADLTKNIDATEFSSPHVTVLRVLCVTSTPCTIPLTTAPSILVAFSDTSLTHNGQTTKIGLGSVLPIAPKQTLQIAPTNPTGPAHILLISSH
jgi:hypothetical protein